MHKKNEVGQVQYFVRLLTKEHDSRESLVKKDTPVRGLSHCTAVPDSGTRYIHLHNSP